VAVNVEHSGLVRSIGILSADSDSESDFTAVGLAGQQGSLEGRLREKVVSYLRSGAMVLPLMESTHDVIADSFRVPGGTSLVTDGAFYWRWDAAEYVSVYGIEVLSDALDNMAANDWQPPVLSEARQAEIEDYLADLMGFRAVIRDEDGGQ
jgi:hypothetical protein